MFLVRDPQDRVAPVVLLPAPTERLHRGAETNLSRRRAYDAELATKPSEVLGGSAERVGADLHDGDGPGLAGSAGDLVDVAAHAAQTEPACAATEPETANADAATPRAAADGYDLDIDAPVRHA